MSPYTSPHTSHSAEAAVATSAASFGLFAFGFFERPLGAALVVLAGVGLMMFAPFVVAMLKRARELREVPPTLIVLAVSVFARLAQRRYPHLTPAEALERYLISEAHYGYYTLDHQEGTDQAENTPTGGTDPTKST